MTELIIDSFAGGGGASTGIELALGRSPDIAINHDREAIAMHRANHPSTEHFCESVWDVDPLAATRGRPVGLAWFSPDCKHFSKAKGGKPREKKIRGLAWVVLRWVKTVRPRVIFLENVEEFQTWGPLRADGYAHPHARGWYFRCFVGALRRRGYAVEWRELRACDYGAPTIRKRLFLVARCDGRPIVWPGATHGGPGSEGVRTGRLLAWRTAAECIDWLLPCPSIFARKRPLAEATLRRIAMGIMRYVVNAAEPFVVRTAHGETAAGGSRRWGKSSHAIGEPLVTASNDYALVAPVLSSYYGEGAGGANRNATSAEPLRTQTAENRFALVSAFLAKHYGGVVGSPLPAPIGTVTATDHHSLVLAHMVRQFGASVGGQCAAPLGTVTAGGAGKSALCVSHLAKLRGTSTAQGVAEPLHTVSAQGGHFAEVRAFLIKYYGSDQAPELREPLHTVTARDRFGLVTVAGHDYAIVDIGLRMLTPQELFRAQGFPGGYIIGDDAAMGLALTKSAQVRMCGNSVCPPVACALVTANVPELIRQEIAA